MVYFTCNHCGDSVKKPAVEKHYNTKCRGAPVSVSCMDCLKDFHGDEFVAHTKCISELQKYSGKDYKPRESENKGAKKQESWIDTVRSILDSPEYDLKPGTRQALIKLQGYDNVPRKKAKFINFVTNSVHIPKATVEDVWSILERELERMKQANQKPANAVIPAMNGKVDSSEVQNGNSGGGVENGTKKDKKNKNKANSTQEEAAMKRKANENGAIDNVPMKKKKSNEAEEPRNDIPGKGGKKKKKTQSESEEAIVNEKPVASAQSEGTEDFEWSTALERIVSKSTEGISMEKLKKKLLKKYLKKLAIEELSEKQQKSFDKKLKKCLKKSSFQVNDNFVKSC